MKSNKNKVKICHMTSVHPVKDGRIFYKECTSLAKAGYDVTLIAAGANDEICNGVKIIGVPLKNKSRFNRMFNIGRDVYKKALEINADIYHFHDPELLLFGLKLKRKGKKVIFDSHEFVGKQILTKDYIPKFLRYNLSSAYQKFETYVCKRLDIVIEVCTINGEDYFENRCRKRIFLTNAPIIKDNINEKTTKHDLKRIVHIGGLTYERGITFLATAISQLKCKLILAGPFSSKEYENKIKNICDNKLEYKGILLPSDIPKLLEECGIGVCTLLDKGQYAHIDVLPTKIYDYMLAGLPIIMSNFPYLEKFNHQYNIGLCVPPDNPNAIAEAITYLVTHPEKASEMGENGKKAIIEEFNWDIQEKVLLDLYKDLISNI